MLGPWPTVEGLVNRLDENSALPCEQRILLSAVLAPELAHCSAPGRGLLALQDVTPGDATPSIERGRPGRLATSDVRRREDPHWADLDSSSP